MSVTSSGFTPTWVLRRQKRVGIGPLAMTISVPEKVAARLTTSFPYRRILRPFVYGAIGRTRSLLPRRSLRRRGGMISAAPPSPSDLDRRALSLTQRVAAERWYHMIDVGESVLTPGVVDYRPLAQLVLPESLEGQRCLDLHTRDGFWAFEMERRGAREVTALQRSSQETLSSVPIDGDADPAGVAQAFTAARELAGSRVFALSYAASEFPEGRGKFGMVIANDLLGQVADPQSVLDGAFSLCDGTLILIERFDPVLDRYAETHLVEYLGGPRRGHRYWWSSGIGALRGMLEMAGFEDVEVLITFPVSDEGKVSQMAVFKAQAGSAPKKRAELVAELDAMPPPPPGIDWYHTMELGPGSMTAGMVDHREMLASSGLPSSLRGLRCLDVATFDGFWAFEMERRGSDEVVAIDVASAADTDVPRLVADEVRTRSGSPMSKGFPVAHEALGSKVQHEICSVYDLTPERFGMFDVVFVGDVLVHLRDPQLALDRIRSVCRGFVLLADVYAPGLDAVRGRCVAQRLRWTPGAYFWWAPAASTLTAMLQVAGFTEVDEIARVTQRVGSGRVAKVVLRGKVS